MEKTLLKITMTDVGVETTVCTNDKDDVKALVIALSSVLARNKMLNAVVMLDVLDRMKHPERFEGEAIVEGKLPWED